MSLMFLPENTRVDESYCSQLWVEAERDWDHQAQDKRNADVTEGSKKQRVFLEKSSSAKEMTSSQITAANPTHTKKSLQKFTIFQSRISADTISV